MGQKLGSERKRVIAIAGLTGSGKSLLVNTILEKEVADVSAKKTSCTKIV